MSAYVPTDLALNVPRALPDNPSGDYAPSLLPSCPSTRPSIRSASTLSPEEQSWLNVRRNNTLKPMTDLLARIAIPNFDAASYISSHQSNASSIPNVAIAMSGGGYRAMFNAAGVFAAFDSRSSNSTGAGQLGGLLQSATYLSALSGGNWMVGSIYTNNFTTIDAILNNDGELWDVSQSILQGPSQRLPGVLGTAAYFGDLYDQVEDKANAPGDFNTSITDYWGRALSYQLVNATDGGPQYTWSSIQDQSFITSGEAPLPLLVADGRAPGEKIISVNATNYEFNPWEMGSFDPQGPFGFAPMRYVGSNFSAGSLPPEQPCVRGFDNVGFVMGTSSSLFNQFILQINSTSIPSALKNVIASFLTDLDKNDDDIAAWDPNPFYSYHGNSSLVSSSRSLTLVDGGEDGQNIPLNPLIQPQRHVDVIFAVDSSADTTEYWPNGTSLVATYERSLNSTISNGTSFPAIPDQNTFINSGLNIRPTFFGCNASNATHMGVVAPLVVYLPNGYYNTQSNTSTFQLSYNTTQRNAIIENGWNLATQGNNTVQSDWNVCVGCAILSRSFDRTGTTVPAACSTCFSKYCWDGTTNAADPSSNLNETPKTAQTNISGAPSKRASRWVALIFVSALTAWFVV